MSINHLRAHATSYAGYLISLSIGLALAVFGGLFIAWVIVRLATGEPI